MVNTLHSGYRVGTKPWWKHWFSFSTYIDWALFMYQRATRGWADCDVWALDDYLNDWLPNALRHLKSTTHGYPTCLNNEHEWGAILTKIIVGFEANKRMMDGLYESELGEYPTGSLDFNDPIRKAVIKDRMELEKPLIARDEELFAEGMALFVKYYNNLWD